MKDNPLIKLENFGQSIWMDYIKRDLIKSGELQRLIEEDALRGITSNPSIFEKAISEGKDYTQEIKKLAGESIKVEQIYEILTQRDIRDAADQFRDLYDKIHGLDGYVSLEVNPHHAHDTNATIEEARHLWKTLNRPNVLIKVPATKEGLPAIQKLISEGINVNVTLLFGLERYKEVAEAYINGLKIRMEQGKPIDHIASVASFFLSRIDVLVDPILEKIINKKNEHSKMANELHGQTAIASASLAYEIYKDIFSSDQFKPLSAKGARTQRLLWASTSTKNPIYSDIKYVEALICPNTVNTLPLETLKAYRDHGHPKIRLGLDFYKAKWFFHCLSLLGINMDKVTEQLEKEGVAKFNEAYDKLIEALKEATLHSYSKESI